jgi:hypothetical protein
VPPAPSPPRLTGPPKRSAGRGSPDLARSPTTRSPRLTAGNSTERLGEQEPVRPWTSRAFSGGGRPSARLFCCGERSDPHSRTSGWVSSESSVVGYDVGAMSLHAEELVMSNSTGELSCEIELRPGEKLCLPPALTDSVGAGRWLVSVKPVNEDVVPVRSHDAFLEATTRRTRVCTMTVQAGELWVADIPFTHGLASKKWPVLVLWLDGLDAIVSAVTTAAPRSPTDVPLTAWQASGLRLPSTVRLARLDCLEQSLLIHRLVMAGPENSPPFSRLHNESRSRAVCATRFSWCAVLTIFSDSPNSLTLLPVGELRPGDPGMLPFFKNSSA